MTIGTIGTIGTQGSSSAGNSATASTDAMPGFREPAVVGDSGKLENRGDAKPAAVPAASSDGLNWDKLLGNTAAPATSTTPTAGTSAGIAGSGTASAEPTKFGETVPASLSAIGGGDESSATSISAPGKSSGRLSISDSSDATASSSNAAGRSSVRSSSSKTRGTRTGTAVAASGRRNANVANEDAHTAMYTVKPNETLSAIAAAHYGEARYYLDIEKANPKINPNRLRPGTKIVLPDVSDEKSNGTASSATIATAAAGHSRSDDAPTIADASEVSAAAGGGVITVGLISGNGVGNDDVAASPVQKGAKTYRVRAGDTLYKISKRVYGTPRMADAIYQLNEDRIGPNKAKLKLNAVLAMPRSSDGLVSASAAGAVSDE